jgi:o-succinylbenzoate---CoA ligase
MLVLDFSKKTPLPVADGYYQIAIDFVQKWQGGQQQFLLSTSGSTGQPKTITVERKQMIASALATGNALQLHAGTVAYCCLNVAYVAGIMMLVRAQVLCWKLYLSKPSANPFLEEIFPEKLHFTALVPMQLQVILEQATSRQNLLKHSGLQKILLGGAAISQQLSQQLQQLEPQFYIGYGMTETLSHIALRPLNGPKQANFYTTLEGVQIQTDLRNTLKIRGQITQNKWLQTNDVVELLAADRFCWLGRADRVINSGGIKINLDVAEAELVQLFDEQGVVLPKFVLMGKADQLFGQKLVLVTADIFFEKSEKKVGEVLAQIESKKRPKEIILLPELPLTVSGKTDMQKLQKILEK